MTTSLAKIHFRQLKIPPNEAALILLISGGGEKHAAAKSRKRQIAASKIKVNSSF